MKNIMTNRKLSLLAGSIVLVLGTLACVVNLGGPAYPSERIPVSTEAVTQVQDILGTADAQGAEAGKINLVMTEAQLTSYLTDQLQQQSEPLITDPQVYLRDGTMQIYGKASQGYFTANVKIVISIGVDAEGQPKIELTSANFGPFPVPPSLRDMITNMARDAYASALGSAVTHFQLESVTIADGTLSLVGNVK